MQPRPTQGFSTDQAFNFLLFESDQAGDGKSEKPGGNWIRELDRWLLRFDEKGRKTTVDNNRPSDEIAPTELLAK
jgi:hypothetical protein